MKHKRQSLNKGNDDNDNDNENEHENEDEKESIASIDSNKINNNTINKTKNKEDKPAANCDNISNSAISSISSQHSNYNDDTRSNNEYNTKIHEEDPPPDIGSKDNIIIKIEQNIEHIRETTREQIQYCNYNNNKNMCNSNCMNSTCTQINCSSPNKMIKDEKILNSFNTRSPSTTSLYSKIKSCRSPIPINIPSMSPNTNTTTTIMTQKSLIQIVKHKNISPNTSISPQSDISHLSSPHHNNLSPHLSPQQQNYTQNYNCRTQTSTYRYPPREVYRTNANQRVSGNPLTTNNPRQSLPNNATRQAYPVQNYSNNNQQYYNYNGNYYDSYNNYNMNYNAQNYNENMAYYNNTNQNEYGMNEYNCKTMNNNYAAPVTHENIQGQQNCHSKHYYEGHEYGHNYDASGNNFQHAFYNQNSGQQTVNMSPDTSGTNTGN